MVYLIFSSSPFYSGGVVVNSGGAPGTHGRGCPRCAAGRRSHALLSGGRVGFHNVNSCPFLAAATRMASTLTSTLLPTWTVGQYPFLHCSVKTVSCRPEAEANISRVQRGGREVTANI